MILLCALPARGGKREKLAALSDRKVTRLSGRPLPRLSGLPLVLLSGAPLVLLSGLPLPLLSGLPLSLLSGRGPLALLEGRSSPEPVAPGGGGVSPLHPV
mmetsp:Transcript_23317/g.28187  ORF Transcript_23317/g.28187 Transcript_23317/m.28187 type:complete len:100 (-) Transcript_23317:1097-1396(-)